PFRPRGRCSTRWGNSPSGPRTARRSTWRRRSDSYGREHWTHLRRRPASSRAPSLPWQPFERTLFASWVRGFSTDGFGNVMYGKTGRGTIWEEILRRWRLLHTRRVHILTHTP